VNEPKIRVRMWFVVEIPNWELLQDKKVNAVDLDLLQSTYFITRALGRSLPRLPSEGLFTRSP
jgi:hypothetical protein